MVADALADAIDGAQSQPRSDQVIGWVAARAEARQAATLVVRNTVAAEALRAVLDESPATPLGWADVVDVRTLASVGKAGVAGSELCVPGSLPRGRVALFALPPATAVTVLACGPRETRRVLRTVVAARARLAELCRETVEVSGPRLGVVVSPVKGIDPAAGIEIVDGGKLRLPTEADLDPSGPNPFVFDVLSTLAGVGAGSDEDISDVRTDDPAGAELVTVIEVQLARALSLFIEPNDIVTRRRGTALSRVAAKALAAGDRLLLVTGPHAPTCGSPSPRSCPSGLSSPRCVCSSSSGTSGLRLPGRLAI